MAKTSYRSPCKIKSKSAAEKTICVVVFLLSHGGGMRPDSHALAENVKENVKGNNSIWLTATVEALY